MPPDRRVRSRLVPAAVILWAAAITGVLSGLESGRAVLAGGLLVALGTAIITRRHRRLEDDRVDPPSPARTHLTATAVVTAVVLCITGPVQLLRTDAQEQQLVPLDRAVEARTDPSAPDLMMTIDLRIRTPPAPIRAQKRTDQGGETELSTAGDRVTAHADPVERSARLGRDRVELPDHTRVIVALDSSTRGDARLQPGDQVQVRGRIDRRGTTVFIDAAEIRPAHGLDLTGPWRPAQLRGRLHQHLQAATSVLPADRAALVRGMAIGDTTGMSEELDEAMKISGLTHLVAASGANIALACACAAIPLLLLGVRRRIRVLMSIASAVGYLLIVGPEPSLLRAFAMVLPLLVARFIGLRTSALNALCLTVITYSALWPPLAASVGFILSAAATGAILTLARPTAAVIRELTAGRVPEIIALAVAVPLVAQAACTPVLILLRPEVSLWAVPANMAAEIVVAPTTVVGFLALTVALVSPGVAAPMLQVAGWGAEAVIQIAEWSRILPGAQIPVPDGARGALLAAVVLTGVLALTWQRHRPAAWALAACLVLIAAGPGIVRSASIRFAPPAWTMALCDVGQGDALLTRMAPDPSAPVVLIDTGPDPQALTGCLDALGVDRIDLVVLTHPHADHTGGLPALTGERSPSAAWVCPLDTSTPPHLPATTNVRTAVRGDALTLGQGRLDVLWPTDADTITSVAARESSSGEQAEANDCSVTVALTWADGARLVALGDLEPAAQAALAELGAGHADVVKVAHHGSRRQDDALYRQLAPSLAVIGVGEDNTFGHPHPDALRLISDRGATIVRSDLHGLTLISSDGGGAWRVHPQRSDLDSVRSTGRFHGPGGMAQRRTRPGGAADRQRTAAAAAGR
ncbi:ComEC/Rec2 family competence protein [Helcobacillus massiliensis]|uniref:ComEC/Rec2 family competence protein n=1 Tax=Helcobacillus massiliensis TaxID=521392 RepID=UPI002557358B|nr:ComEC/Rec2 family competence protein [Helcobacillus massiliensis]MDK7741246.1 ComEC/Rec2 family competence protein [Helcobacillus massiliensis]WOO94050.1 ComEC/Rec2 family competence protein [Helcobacillus massiliensis]